jgi:ribonuclease R
MATEKKTASAKKGKPIDIGELVLGLFKKHPNLAYNHKQACHALGITDSAAKELVRKQLPILLKKGSINEVKRGKYKLNFEKFASLAPRKNYVTGIVDMKQTGKAYIITDEPGEDIFIAANGTGHALNGDKVKVLLFPRRPGRKTEGQVVEILQRAKEEFVGVIQLSKHFAYLIPDHSSMPVDIYLPLERILGAKDGDKAIARITDWPERSKNPFGEVITVLGRPGEHEVEMNSILAEFGFPLSFPQIVAKEADKIPVTITAEEISKRRDFRDVFTITIDPEDAKDFDDALSLKTLENGNFEVGVHIADVSHYIEEGGIIDEEASKRGTSVYLVDRVVPMLPELLSNFVCSLRPDEEKLCFSAVFEMNEQADIVEQWFGRTVIKSNKRFNYDEAQELIQSGTGQYSKEIGILQSLALKLREARFRKGSIAFETEEVKFRLDEKGKPIGVYIKQYKDSNKLIEDFMLLANRRVAEYISGLKGKSGPKTFVYRIHDKPNPEKLSIFSAFVAKLGYSINSGTTKSLAKSFNSLFTSIKGKGEENLINSLALRTMQKAVYSTQNIGHYGLAFAHYTHFTSPIRRYPDLMVHRLLARYLAGKPSADKKTYEDLCDHSSDMERRATEAERMSVKFKQAEYLSDKLGQVFEGRITGISKWGIYAEISDSKCEGMISIRDLTDDVYHFDEDNYVAVGQYSGKRYRLGDNVKIQVKRVDLSRKQIDFVFPAKTISG